MSNQVESLAIKKFHKLTLLNYYTSSSWPGDSSNDIIIKSSPTPGVFDSGSLLNKLSSIETSLSRWGHSGVDKLLVAPVLEHNLTLCQIPCIPPPSPRGGE